MGRRLLNALGMTEPKSHGVTKASMAFLLTLDKLLSELTGGMEIGTSDRHGRLWSGRDPSDRTGVERTRSCDGTNRPMLIT